MLIKNMLTFNSIQKHPLNVILRSEEHCSYRFKIYLLQEIHDCHAAAYIGGVAAR